MFQVDSPREYVDDSCSACSTYIMRQTNFSVVNSLFPASPRSCCVISTICIMPVAPNGVRRI